MDVNKKVKQKGLCCFIETRHVYWVDLFLQGFVNTLTVASQLNLYTN